MSVTKPYLFIANPYAGDTTNSNHAGLALLIEEKMQALGKVSQVIFTESRGHASEIAKTAVRSNQWSAIVVAGGDGTINEVAVAMLHSHTPLGIIPLGSGNGLARHLHIPMNPVSALNRLTEGSPVRIDTARINDIPFFCTAGIGFDAAVSHGFASSAERGLKNYVRCSLDIFKKYRPIEVWFDGQLKPTFLLTFANAGQYGNNAWIAPKASITDGLLNLCHIKPFPDWYTMVFGARLFAKTLDESQYVSYKTFGEIEVKTKVPLSAHYDGEPFAITSERITVKCVPQSLTVIC